MLDVRGEFEYEYAGKKLVIPNQFTNAGMLALLLAAFKGTASAWKIGLCNHNPADVIAAADMLEPDTTNGYARQAVDLLTAANWPNSGLVNGETYIESKTVTFTATGAYNRPSSRFCILIGATPGAGTVVAVSSAFPSGPVVISANLSTKYRLFFR